MDLPDATDPSDEIQQLSAQIVQLYGLLSQNSQLRAQIRGAAGDDLDQAGYESLRSQLDATVAEREFLGEEIVRRVGRIAELQRELERQKTHAEGPDADTLARLAKHQEIELELQLGQELLDLASAQVAAIRRWNQNPDRSKLREFEAEYTALYEKYRAVRQRLTAVRARLSDDVAPIDQSPDQPS